MILDVSNIKQIRSFILDDATEEELERCEKCQGEDETIKKICEYKEICERYSSIVPTEKMVIDLFDTIEYLLEDKTDCMSLKDPYINDTDC